MWKNNLCLGLLITFFLQPKLRILTQFFLGLCFTNYSFSLSAICHVDSHTEPQIRMMMMVVMVTLMMMMVANILEWSLYAGNST